MNCDEHNHVKAGKVLALGIALHHLFFVRFEFQFYSRKLIFSRTVAFAYRLSPSVVVSYVLTSRSLVFLN